MAAVYALAAAYTLFCLFTNPAGPYTTPDSIHYLNLSPIVPLGYPFFLKLTGAGGAIVVQPILFGASLAFLGREVVRTTRSVWLALAIVAGTIAVPQVRGFHASVLSESLFLSLLVVFLALAVRFTYEPSWHLMVLVATGAGLSATVRRTGFALVPVMLAMMWLQRHGVRRSGWPLFLAAALAPFAVLVGAEQAAAPIVHAGRSSSLMGRHLFAKAALVEAPRALDAEPTAWQLDKHLDEDFAPIRRLLASAPRDVRAVLAIYYETCLQGGCVDRSRAVMADRGEAAQTRELGRVALGRLLRAPVSFARLTALHYGSLWTVNRLQHPDTAPALTAFIAANRPLPFEKEAFSLEPAGTLAFEARPWVRYAQWIMSTIAIVTGAAAAIGVITSLARRSMPPAHAVACVSALTAHAGLLLTALLAAGFTRFMLGVWPAIVTACGFVVFAGIQRARQSGDSTLNSS